MSDGNGGDKQPRIGVYVCHCGTNIAGTVDVESVARWAGEPAGRGRGARLQVHVLVAWART